MTRKHKAWLPALVAVLPILAEAVRTVVVRSQLFFWGDQALIDLVARDTLRGRNLLGVYDRYRWHHLGPTWLGLIGVARWLGSGSRLSVVLGAYAVQAVAAAGIVLVAHRLRPGLVAWWAALVVAGYEWSLGVDRLTTVWAPYSVALPAALLVLLVADMASGPNPWPATVGAVACASFLVQTEISTIVLSVVLLVSAPLLRFASQGMVVPVSPGRRAKAKRQKVPGSEVGGLPNGDSPGRRWRAKWGWATRAWGAWLTVLAAVTVLLWTAPVFQQLSSRSGNLSALYRFFTTHSGHQSLYHSLSALDTVLGAFPLRLGTQDGHNDANASWLVVNSPWARPIFLAYLAAAACLVALAIARRQRDAFAASAASGAALVAAGLSLPTVYGPLYPYLVFWMGSIVVPFWIGAWLVLVPLPKVAPASAKIADRRWQGAARRLPPRALPLGAFAVAGLIGVVYAAGPLPMTHYQSQLGRNSWKAVAPLLLASAVREVYIDVPNAESMPDAAAIADQAVRLGLHVEVNQGSVYYFDPSFAPDVSPQIEVLVCCATGPERHVLAGMSLRGRVGGEDIYAGRWATVVRANRHREAPVTTNRSSVPEAELLRMTDERAGANRHQGQPFGLHDREPRRPDLITGDLCGSGATF